MARIADEDIQKVLAANDLVSIAQETIPNLKQRGSKFVACCPFHKEKTPSFQIDQNLQLWHCFGCGEGGNLVTFVEKQYDMNFVETMEFLAQRANIELHHVNGAKTYDKSKKGRLKQACNMAAQYYHRYLLCSKSTQANAARTYLGNRNFGTNIAKKWTLGFALGHDQLTKYLLSKKFSVEELLTANLSVKGRDNRAHDRFFNRIIFPIFDVFGDVIAFGGRVIDDSQPKYLNTNETPLFHKSKCLYGIDKAKTNMSAKGCAVVVEGYTDVISLHKSGINYTVATLGTALTREHIRILNQHAKKKIIYLFDGDEAGQRAAERALMFIDQMDLPERHRRRAQIYALTLPDNLDPAEYIDKYGADKLLKLLDSAKPLLDYGIEKKIEKYDLEVPGNKSLAAASALSVLAPIKDSLLAKEYAARIANMTSMRPDDLLQELSKLKSPKVYSLIDSGSVQSRTNGLSNFNKNEDLHDVNTTYNEPNSYSTLDKIEVELLCLFSKYPTKIYDFEIINKDINPSIEDFWENSKNYVLYKNLKKFVDENPRIKSNELIYKVNKENPKDANLLTSFSKMHDIKNDPDRHLKYLIYLHKIETLSMQLDKIKNQYETLPSGDKKEDIFAEFNMLQNQLNEFKAKKDKVI